MGRVFRSPFVLTFGEAFKSEIARHRLSPPISPCWHVCMSSPQLKFSGFRVAAAFVTAKGYRGLRAPTHWARQLVEAAETDDSELALVALESPLADVAAVVEGGGSGAPYSIGGFGFFSGHQFEGPLQHCLDEKHRQLEGASYLSPSDLEQIDAHLEDIVRHTRARFAGVKQGDTFVTIAVERTHRQAMIMNAKY